ncbi:uncharacterized protein LTR77_000243 [Saxophila tyrrhenica]|uniref:O-methyltransferase n=1 Tax=Saxophila tyrrhenica TaxID=1690608 RepID=A0AAV9PM89_9PEZI|nr:hypothetical protein LTR77_000243 [Saxophila tyrrhenica]
MASSQATRTAMMNHEHDERWTAVDAWALDALHPKESHLYEHIQFATELSETKGLPSIEVSHLQGKYLMTQCQMIDAKKVLEVGTLGGISAIWMASAGPDVRVTSIEVDEHHKAVAEEAIAHAGLSDRVEVLLGAGVDVLPKIRAQVESGERPKFDYVFIDADKGNNFNYYNEALLMCRSRACIIVDNVVRMGLLADDSAAENPGVKGARVVIGAAGKDGRLLGTSLLQTVGEKNYDGFLVCIVK